ncbi:hypothetical protein MOK15_19165 [Sphingobium sp. BYY-5]|uniref:hypothetical protein n=1 Tax=Sphingobium sp. BYY-5 TaxID=2926400 RepID=UPI001FA7D31B|nr:hypothetical protein [Sphingobium sp. BYY-5]MCI4592203.1 hypothetical protein [Sphingobium sp. BYY-5]
MPRQPTAYQFDLFLIPSEGQTAPVPPWQTLPDETRRKLKQLMARLILDYVAGEPANSQEGVGHDA